jgi:FkbM family methyltransferase
MQISWRKKLSRIVRGKLRRRILSNHGEGIVANTRNGLLVVDPGDFGVSRALLDRGSYDWPEIQWLGRLIDAQSQLVFVGTHIGALLVPLVRNSGATRVRALEPSPRNHRFLSMNVALNGLDFASVLQVAAGNQEGHVRFAENSINSGNSRISAVGNVEVRVAKLDTVLADCPPVDLLVMDTEGFEVEVMRGGAELLQRTRYLYVEYAPEQLREQGHAPADFIQQAAAHFDSMYVRGAGVEFFPNKSFARHLAGLPHERGLLLNLLFSNDAAPRSDMMTL